MFFVWISLGILLLIAAGMAWRWWYLFRQRSDEPLSAVSRQHLELYNGGVLDEGELELTKMRYNQWLLEGRLDRIQISLVPGLSYVVRVRALAELGTNEACAILEKQMNRVLTDDPIEQAWYWIDVAHCLRLLSRDESLNVLLERVAQADDFPLVRFYASEVVAFSHFADYLKDFPHRLGEAAVRAFHRVLEGLRCGISAQIVAEARLGEMLETVWDLHGHIMHPLLIRLFSEALRHQRRSRQYAEELSREHFEQEAYEMQLSRIAALEGHLVEYLSRAKASLPERLDRLPHHELADWLDAILELRADAGPALVQLLRDSLHQPLAEHAILALGWSPSAQAAGYLREVASRSLSIQKHHSNKWFENRIATSHQVSLSAAALLSLRHHPSIETEQIILAAVRSSDLYLRAAAVSSLGWWDPLRRQAVLMFLQDARYDRDGEVRHAARAALARMGERQALQWFRQGLISENRHIVLESIQAIADEGITLLWPELDSLVDEEEPELASCAREALEQMQEELERDRR